jgi:phage anti-repressor protein
MSKAIFNEDTALLLLDSPQQFPVDFDRAWKWLGFSRKDNAKQSLLDCGFIQTVDFLINQELETPTVTGWVNPNPKENIWLTIDCFKTWGMMANTSQGKQVRTYFLRCEKIAKQKSAELLQSQQALFTELADRISRLEAKTAPALPPVVPELTRAMQVKELVYNYVERMDGSYEKAWRLLYSKFGLLYSWKPLPKSKLSKIAQIEAAGKIEELYQLALKIFL